MAPYFVIASHASPTKATAAYQLFNYAEDVATARGRTLLRVHLDETMVCLYPGRGRGAVFIPKRMVREGRGQHVPLWKRRCNMTHVGVVCDRADVQAVLPQFLIASGRALVARSLAALQLACPPNVQLLRQDKAWNEATIMG